jgi:hypothetical protein
MVNLKPSGNKPPQPKPNYGHLSETHPEFIPLKEGADKDFAGLWQLPYDQFKKAWDSFPPALLDDSPVEGKDVTIEHMKVPVRDGTQIEIRIYKPVNTVPNALLNLNCHGGGTFCANKPRSMMTDELQGGWWEIMALRKGRIG